MKRFVSEKQKIGQEGELICKQWLEKNGFMIIERNYTIRLGEIDIIAQKEGKIHFIEVKSISRETTDNFSRETIYNPAENVTRKKIIKCFKVINEYKQKKNISNETQFDVYIVYKDKRNIKHFIERIENVL